MRKLMPVSIYRKLAVGQRYFKPSARMHRAFENTYITCAGKTDGACAQVLAVLSTQVFASDVGLRYVHTPFRQIEHNAEGDALWAQRWENFFGLGTDEVSIDDIDINNFQVLNIPDLSMLKPSPTHKRLYVVSHCHDYTTLFPERYVKHLTLFSQKYYRHAHNQASVAQQQGNDINIALHIRRGDVAANNKYARRFTDNEMLRSRLDTVLSVVHNQGLNATLSIYSQGEKDDFKDIVSTDYDIPVHFYLDGCVFDTFRGLVNSDVLIMAKGAFSFTAALLGKGVKIYDPLYHRALKSWITISAKNGSFNHSKFEKALSAYVFSR